MSNVNKNRRLAEIESGQAELRNSERQANFAAGQIELFRLAEDAEGNGPAYAQRIDYTGQEAGTSLTQVYGHSNHLDGVRAGVAIPFARIAGKWIGLTFGCQQDCPHLGEINLGDVLIGQVGEEFTHEISLSNIVNKRSCGRGAAGWHVIRRRDTDSQWNANRVRSLHGNRHRPRAGSQQYDLHGDEDFEDSGAEGDGGWVNQCSVGRL